VHAVAALLAEWHAGGPGVLDQDLIQVILIGERADRGGVPDEHLRAVVCRTAVPQVVDDRPADILEQVEVGKLQSFDIDAAQPEPGDQQGFT
jgi:hypothetical protein